MEFYDFDSWGNQPMSAEEELGALLHSTHTASAAPFIQSQLDMLRVLGVADTESLQGFVDETRSFMILDAMLACLQEAIFASITRGVPPRLQPVLEEAIKRYPNLGEELVNYIDDLRHLRY